MMQLKVKFFASLSEQTGITETTVDTDSPATVLDAWQLAGFREVVFQEGLDPALPVRVVATGDAVWRDTNGKEQRDIRLSFKGEAPSGR